MKVKDLIQILYNLFDNWYYDRDHEGPYKNVKLYDTGIPKGFENLVQEYHGTLDSLDKKYLYEFCDRYENETSFQQQIYEWVVEDMCNSIFDMDFYVNDVLVKLELHLAGRSCGQLVLTEFEGLALSDLKSDYEYLVRDYPNYKKYGLEDMKDIIEELRSIDHKLVLLNDFCNNTLFKLDAEGEYKTQLAFHASKYIEDAIQDDKNTAYCTQCRSRIKT